jgi:hypothetical protein
MKLLCACGALLSGLFLVPVIPLSQDVTGSVQDPTGNSNIQTANPANWDGERAPDGNR